MEFVFSANDGVVLWSSGSTVRMRPNDVWFADDPFVVARPELFSATPLQVYSTAGRLAPPRTPIEAPRAATEQAIVDAGFTAEQVVEVVRRGRGRRSA